MLAFVLIMLALVIAAGGVIFLARRRRRLRAEPVPPYLPELSDRSVSIVALGHEQAGKTVLLASMFRELGISGDSRVDLVPDHDSDLSALRKLWRQIEDTQEPFPSGTTLGEEKIWKFTARSHNENDEKVEVCKFSYYDYPGEFLDRAALGDHPHPEFERALRSADIIVGLVDGQMVLHLMEDRLNGETDQRFGARLSDLCALLNSRDLKTLHIIITKWDLLHGRYKLDRVIARLKSYNRLFEKLLDTPRSGCVRVIPVSALGISGFAYEDPVSGAICKVANRPWIPMHVVAPLACVIPDVIATDARRLNAGSRRANAGRVIYRDEVSTLFFWCMVALSIAIPHVASTAAFASPVFAEMRQVVLRVSAGKIVDSVAKRISGRRHRGDQTSLVRMLSYLQSEVEFLEERFPAAKIKG